MAAYYNEINPFAAMWLRVLIQQGHIPAGDVDTRSIEDVRPDDLKPYTQCHFFAGVGVWALALRRAGWPDNREVWTGSCPCQPFSAAGKGEGFDDERHLWPAWFHLIQQRRPREVLGEQVASKDGLAWLDLVQADLEAAHYTHAAIDLCAAGVGAPHLRQRLWLVADADGERSQGVGADCDPQGWQGQDFQPLGLCDGAGDCIAELADSEGQRCSKLEQLNGDVQDKVRTRESDCGRDCCGEDGQLGNPSCERCTEARTVGDGQEKRLADAGTDYSAGATKGFWAGADWLGCKDGKFRAVEAGTFPLADGAAARVGSLCGYGNAINAEAAKAFISSYMESKQILHTGAQQ